MTILHFLESDYTNHLKLNIMKTKQINNQYAEALAGVSEQINNYYAEQLARVNTNSEYAPKIKVFSEEGGKDTNFMNLNKESAQALIEWLKTNFTEK